MLLNPAIFNHRTFDNLKSVVSRSKIAGRIGLLEGRSVSTAGLLSHPDLTAIRNLWLGIEIVESIAEMCIQLKSSSFCPEYHT